MIANGNEVWDERYPKNKETCPNLKTIKVVFGCLGDGFIKGIFLQNRTMDKVKK